MPETLESETTLRRYPMPFGDLYTRAWSQGDALGDIARSDAGLLALDAFCAANSSRFQTRSVAALVRRFLSLPDVSQRFSLALAIQRRRRAQRAIAHCRQSAIAHAQARRRMSQQAEFDAHNRERGLAV